MLSATTWVEYLVHSVVLRLTGRAQTFNYRDSDFMTEAGMRVHETPVEINGELIEPPPIMYGPSRGSNHPDVLVSASDHTTLSTSY